jgi:AAA+ ATPase superfamily predicted ATPase
MKFVDRKWELAVLDEMWASSEARFLVLYGHRRIGKTRLLTHWLRDRRPRSIYWVAKPASSAVLLRSFSQTLYREARGEEADPAFTYPSWEMAWQEVENLARGERLALFLDEFTYTLDATPDLAGTLQNAWDQHLSGSNLFLVLSGSHLGMMERELLAYRAPLYGRANARMLLRQLPFSALREVFPDWNAEARVALYATLGGIPAYLERFDAARSFAYNVKNRLLTPLNLLQEEPRLLLQEQLSEPRNYMTILEAIAHDHRVPQAIAEVTGLARSHVSKYLSVLEGLRLVRREVPATVRHPERSRRGRFGIVDPYLRFYFRFLANRQDQIALGRIASVWQQIQRHMVDFIGTHTFEELCRDWVSVAGDAGRLPFVPERVGSFWSTKAQVDVVAINWMEKQILLGEVKWSHSQVGRRVVEELVAKTPRVLPAGDWSVHYAFFARAGFTEPARIAAREHGSLLVDLEQLDQDSVQDVTHPGG